MSKAQAITQAASEIGVERYDDTKVEAALVQLGDQSLPFLTGQLAGRRTWRIEFSNVSLDKHAKKRLPKNGYVKHLVVFLSPDTGHVMKVVSRWPEGVPRIAPYPPCADEERQMKMSGKRYDGLPSEAPGVTLVRPKPSAYGRATLIGSAVAARIQYALSPVSPAGRGERAHGKV